MIDIPGDSKELLQNMSS